MIKTIEDLKAAYPDLVRQLEDEVRREVEAETLRRLRRLLIPEEE